MRPINKQDYESYLDDINDEQIPLISSHNLEDYPTDDEHLMPGKWKED